MRPTTSEQLREAFLEYFEEHRHQRVPSSSLIPYNDATLLLTNAGMVQFKDVFLGLETRPYQRATTSQKCMRVSGKHNDLENVGPSARHHTFFEMLGNFSFGDYFKRDAIRYAYEFLTVVVGLSPDRLYYTVYQDDDEAFDVWTREVGVAAERVYRMGEKTNFWSMGDVGPCGPTSEVHYDWGAEACTCGRPDCSVFIDNGCGRWLEVWNLVFMQFNQDASGTRTRLPKPGVDTGMGLERITSIVQNKAANYDTDLFVPIMERTQALLGHTDAERSQNTVGYRVIADHARAAAFLVADGVRPGPAGAGFVLRLVIRRAFRYGRKLGFQGPFLAQVCEAVIAKMGRVYPELRDRRSLIIGTVTLEEEQFISTLDRALSELDRALETLTAAGQRVLPGDIAFDLKATHGLPLEVTRDICLERGFTVDEAGFVVAEEEHRRVSHGKLSEAVYAVGAEQYLDARNRLQHGGLLAEGGVTYDPYGPLSRTSQLVGMLRGGEWVETADAGEQVELILTETPFYVEAGGQVSDVGAIVAADWRADVTEVRRPVSGLTVHVATVREGQARVGAIVDARVDSERRWHIMRNHTATHLLHRALRLRLGEHVHQAGSLVAPDRLRFDFTHDEALSEADIAQITDTVSAAVLADFPVRIAHKPQKEALAEGAMALFGEKYGDVVRTVTVGDGQVFWSYELCGGTHVQSTGQIGAFFVTHEGSVGRGVRRIEAVTGVGAEAYALTRLATVERLARALRVPAEAVEEKVYALQDEVSALTRELQRVRQQQLAAEADTMTARAQIVGGVRLLAVETPAADVDALRRMSDDLRNKLGSGVVVLAADLAGRPSLVVALTPDLVARGGDANRLAKTLAAIIGGGGGGRADVATAGGRDAGKLAQALAAASGEVERMFGPA